MRLIVFSGFWTKSLSWEHRVAEPLQWSSNLTKNCRSRKPRNTYLGTQIVNRWESTLLIGARFTLDPGASSMSVSWSREHPLENFPASQTTWINMLWTINSENTDSVVSPMSEHCKCTLAQIFRLWSKLPYYFHVFKNSEVHEVKKRNYFSIRIFAHPGEFSGRELKNFYEELIKVRTFFCSYSRWNNFLLRKQRAVVKI